MLKRLKPTISIILYGLLYFIIIIGLLHFKFRDKHYSEAQVRKFLTKYEKDLDIVANYMLDECTYYENNRLKNFLIIGSINTDNKSFDLYVTLNQLKFDYTHSNKISEYSKNYIPDEIFPSIKKILKSKIAFVNADPGSSITKGACINFCFKGYKLMDYQMLIYVPKGVSLYEGSGTYIQLSDHWYYNCDLDHPK